MIYFFVGLMGAGKSHVAKRIANKMEALFIEGDDFVPPDMVKKVLRFQPLSQEDIDNYVYNHLIPKVEAQIKDLADSKNIFIAQGAQRGYSPALWF